MVKTKAFPMTRKVVSKVQGFQGCVETPEIMGTYAATVPMKCRSQPSS